MSLVGELRDGSGVWSFFQPRRSRGIAGSLQKQRYVLHLEQHMADPEQYTMLMTNIRLDD